MKERAVELRKEKISFAKIAAKLSQEFQTSVGKSTVSDWLSGKTKDEDKPIQKEDESEEPTDGNST